jgi:poly-gamma-glutamate synthesis protein (capsule biosynthesis protein)
MAERSKISIVAVGDIMLGDGVQRIRRGVRAAWQGKRLSESLAHLRPLLSGKDLCIGNLECMLGDVHPRNPRRMTYKGEAVHVDGLRALGFTHLALANNHILDEGLDVARQTKEFTEEAGITPLCGTAAKRTTIAGNTVEIFCFNLIQDHTAAGFYRDEVTEQDFALLKSSDADVKIICIHWGDEYAEYPSPQQIELAHRFVDCGAQVVLGHHPHVIQGVERYKGAVVAYSLGNFVFDMDWSVRTRSALALEIELTDKAVSSVVKNYLEAGRDYVPRTVEASANLIALDPDVLRFQGNATAYDTYRKAQLRKARIQALIHLFSRFYTVHPKTWEILFGRRLQRLLPKLKQSYAQL